MPAAFHEMIAMIDHTRQLLFIHIARTGGTSIEGALVGSDWWFIEPTTKHLSASQARNQYGEPTWNSYTKFSVVRNPWDRVVSMWATGWWHADGTGHHTEILRDFIRRLEPHKVEYYRALQYNLILDQELDFVLRFENLQADFSGMLKAINQPDVILPHLEGRNRKHYRAYYDSETAEMVARIYEDDIRRFGYTF
jgi:hypothetical protein